MMNLTDIRSVAFKWRGGLWTVLYLIILLLAKRTREGIFFGLIFVIAGQMVRCWAAGSIGLYRGVEVKASQLVTWGPYAIVRNTLYLGKGLIGIGWAIYGRRMSFSFFVISFWINLLLLIIPHEETFLENKFGDSYLDTSKNWSSFN